MMMDHFETGATLVLLESERINYAFMVPTMVNAIVHDNSARGRDFSAMKCLLITAAPIQDATALAARDVFGDVLYQGYGQTEVLPVSMMNSSQWFAEIEGSNPLRACGLALPYAEVEIWDEDDQPLPANEVGEIVARSDGMMSEFWNNPEATRERIVNGWIKTGDLGKLDSPDAPRLQPPAAEARGAVEALKPAPRAPDREPAEAPPSRQAGRLPGADRAQARMQVAALRGG